MTEVKNRSERFFSIRLKLHYKGEMYSGFSEMQFLCPRLVQTVVYFFKVLYYLCRSKPTSRLQPSSAGVLQFWAPAPDTHDAAYWTKWPLIRVSSLPALRGHRIGLLLQSNWPDVCKKWQGSLLQSIYSYSIYIAMNSPHKMPKLLPFFSKYIFKVLNRQKGSHNKRR